MWPRRFKDLERALSEGSMDYLRPSHPVEWLSIPSLRLSSTISLNWIIVYSLRSKVLFLIFSKLADHRARRMGNVLLWFFSRPQTSFNWIHVFFEKIASAMLHFGELATVSHFNLRLGRKCFRVQTASSGFLFRNRVSYFAPWPMSPLIFISFFLPCVWGHLVYSLRRGGGGWGTCHS